jgi:hypothetical protein
MVSDNQIISLENVREVNFKTGGSGAKSNPYCWWVTVHYKDGDCVATERFACKENAMYYFNKIYEILTAE